MSVQGARGGNSPDDIAQQALQMLNGIVDKAQATLQEKTKDGAAAQKQSMNGVMAAAQAEYTKDEKNSTNPAPQPNTTAATGALDIAAKAAASGAVS